MSKRRCFLLALVGAGLLAVVTWVNSRSYQLWRWEGINVLTTEDVPPLLGGINPEDVARRFFRAYVNQPMMALAYLAPGSDCVTEAGHAHQAMPRLAYSASFDSPEKIVARILHPSDRTQDAAVVPVQLEYPFRSGGKTLTIEAVVDVISRNDGYWYVCAPMERERILARARYLFDGSI